MGILEILILVSAISVALAPAVIRSVLFLMQTFFLAAFYLAVLGADLLALLFLLIYIGAIGVLFLFVIMLVQSSKNEFIQFNFNELKEENETTFDIIFLAISALFFFAFFCLLFLSLLYSFAIFYLTHLIIETPDFAETLYATSSAHVLGTTIFIDYWFPFILITLIIILVSFGVIIILK